MIKYPKMRCLLCGEIVGSDGEIFPDGAVILRADGNYGSTVFDNNGGALEAWIHDACLKKNIRRFVGIRIKHTAPRRWRVAPQRILDET